MKKEIVLVFIISLFLVGCTTELSESQVASAIEDLNNVTDQELQEAIDRTDDYLVGESSRIAKNALVNYQDIIESLDDSVREKKVQQITNKYSKPVLKAVLENRKNYVYVFKFDTKTWEIKAIRVYDETNDAKKLVDKHTKIRNQYLGEHKNLVLEVGKETISIPFEVHDIIIEEDFSGDKISLTGYKEVPLDEVEVRVTLKSPLNNKIFLVKIVDNKKEVFSKEYLLRSETKNLAGLAYEGAQQISIKSNSYYFEGCNSLVEAIPGHNQIGEQRVNLVFYGVGYDNLEFIEYLPNFLDVDGDGFVLEDRCGITYNGLFGKKPFVGNQNLFNFWYSEEPLDFDDDTPTNSVDSCSTGFSKDNVSICLLPNRVDVILMNRTCRSNSAIFLSFRLPTDKNSIAHYTRVFVHEVGHAFGELADEYIEPEQGDRPGYPNCAESIEEGTEWGYENFYAGCSYVDDNTRPHYASIMGDGCLILQSHFQRINEEHLCFRMTELTGREVSCEYTTDEELMQCYDNDCQLDIGGYYSSSSVVIDDGYGSHSQEYKDYCISEFVLSEQICNQNIPVTEEYECPFGCESGSCLTEQEASCDILEVISEGGSKTFNINGGYTISLNNFSEVYSNRELVSASIETTVNDEVFRLWEEKPYELDNGEIARIDNIRFLNPFPGYERSARFCLAYTNCDISDKILEGDIEEFTIDDQLYIITVNEMSYHNLDGSNSFTEDTIVSVQFSVNGESFSLQEGESYELFDDVVITSTHSLYQAYAGGIHQTSFCLTKPDV
jgi:hypothetical protein